MKGNKLFAGLLYGVVAFGIAMAGAWCIVTAFGFTQSGAAVSFVGPGRADMQTVARWCAGLSAVSALVCSQKRKWIFWLTAAAVAAWLLGSMHREIYELAYQISVFFDKAYRWGTLAEPSQIVEIQQSSVIHIVKTSSITGGLVAICAFVTFAVNWALCRGKKSFVAVLAGSLPLAVCCVVTDTVPDEKYLFLLLAGLVLVMFTGAARRDNEKAGARLTAILMVPVLLVSMLISHWMPRERYEEQSQTMLETMLGWVQDLPYFGDFLEDKLDGPTAQKVAETVDLTSVGPKGRPTYPVMDVVANFSATVYLRGQSFDTYTGRQWTNSDKATGVDTGWPESGAALGDITIKTRDRMGYSFVPYYVGGNKILMNGTEAPPASGKESTYRVVEPLVNGVGALPTAAYVSMELDGNTLLTAKEIAEEAYAQLSDKYDGLRVREKWAKVIEEYVGNSAVYSLYTPQMPVKETDFALWFLNDSDTGYCVHFATAAAVLLRSVGIPARYVTGYAVEVRTGQRITITADKAHAWVEYLDDNNIWRVLDATPAEWMSDEEPTEPAPTEEPTEPPTEQPTMEPTAPTGPTEPTPTAPNETQPVTLPGNEGGAGQQEQRVDRSGMLKALNWAIGIAAGGLLLTGQYALRLQLRRKKLKKGDPNRQALTRWRLVLRMAGITGNSVPEELEYLAEKAKFSQHTLTEAEITKFDTWLEQAQTALSQKSWPVKLVLRLFWAV